MALHSTSPRKFADDDLEAPAVATLAPERPAATPDAPPSFLEKAEPAAREYVGPSDRSSLQLYLQEIGKTPS